MPDLLIEDLDPDLIARLEKQATSHGRSLEEEVKAVLEAAARRRTGRDLADLLPQVTISEPALDAIEAEIEERRRGTP